MMPILGFNSAAPCSQFVRAVCAVLYDNLVVRERLRAVEWLLIVYFAYVAALAFAFALPGESKAVTLVILLAVSGIVMAAAWGESRTGWQFFRVFRDWFTLACTLLAYREMNLFTPAMHNGRLEHQWIVWDRLLLNEYGFRRAIESSCSFLPSILELTYFVVYAIGPFALMVLYIENKRERAPTLLLMYQMGALLAYSCFPFFPSEPPRVVFPGADLPQVMPWLRGTNLLMVNGYGIHSSVFPSAHVSSAFGAAFGMLLALPERKKIGYGMLGYAALVAVATVYGRYHYAVDAVAGVAISLVALGIVRVGLGARQARNLPRNAT